MKILKLSLMALLALLSVGTAQAQDNTAEFTYDNGGKQYNYGTSKKETYDVAIYLDKTYAGKKVTAITVPVVSAEGLTDLKVWLTKELKVQNKAVAPDVVMKSGTLATGKVTVTLDEPVTIPAEGLYAGYSLSVGTLNSDSKKPIPVIVNSQPGGFFLHSSRTYLKFVDNSDSYNSVMGVTISGVSANAVNVSLGKEFYGKVGDPTDVDLTLTNAGSQAVTSVDYSYDFGGITGSGHADASIDGVLGRSTGLTIQLPAQDKKAVYPVKITIDKVNGQSNSSSYNTVETKVNVYNTLPKRRPVMEEYTGTWCGWCPRGFVAMEAMSRLHRGEFIGIAYHNADPMEIMTSANFPSSISGFPMGVIDRYYEGVDPYSGYSSEGTYFGIEDVWKDACKDFGVADVEVEGLMNDENTLLTVNASVTSPLDVKGDYKVEFVVVENDLHQADDFAATGKWDQENSFPSRYKSTDFEQPEFAQFFPNTTVSGLHFNDVIVATSRLRGTDTDLPAELKEDVPSTVSATFDLATIVNTNKQSLIQDVNKLSVVALFIDKATGRILNANKAQVSGKNINGIASVTTAQDNAITEVYDLSGRRLQTLQKGVNIARTADGRTVKVVVPVK